MHVLHGERCAVGVSADRLVWTLIIDLLASTIPCGTDVQLYVYLCVSVCRVVIIVSVCTGEANWHSSRVYQLAERLPRAVRQADQVLSVCRCHFTSRPAQEVPGTVERLWRGRVGQQNIQERLAGQNNPSNHVKSIHSISRFKSEWILYLKQCCLLE